MSTFCNHQQQPTHCCHHQHRPTESSDMKEQSPERVVSTSHGQNKSEPSDESQSVKLQPSSSPLQHQQQQQQQRLQKQNSTESSEASTGSDENIAVRQPLNASRNSLRNTSDHYYQSCFHQPVAGHQSSYGQRAGRPLTATIKGLPLRKKTPIFTIQSNGINSSGQCNHGNEEDDDDDNDQVNDDDMLDDDNEEIYSTGFLPNTSSAVTDRKTPFKKTFNSLRMSQERRRQCRSKSLVPCDQRSPYFTPSGCFPLASHRSNLRRIPIEPQASFPAQLPSNQAEQMSQMHHPRLMRSFDLTNHGYHRGGPTDALLPAPLHWNRCSLPNVVSGGVNLNVGGGGGGQLLSTPLSHGVQKGEIPGINKTLSPDDPTIKTIKQHYYPEGGWGWVVTFCVSIAYCLTMALSPASTFLIVDMLNTFKPEEGILAAVLIGSFSTTITLLMSPIIVSICRRKSTRLTAILGGLITALGCLFTSFATQFHQLLISYGLFIGIGTAMIRDTAVIMIGQYFKRKREFVEIFVLSGAGLGIGIMPLFLSYCIRSKNWRFGFQSLALLVFLNFFLAVLYRPASLYHPQRRAILHLKSLQKRSRLKDNRKHHQKSQKKASNTTSNSTTVTNIEKPPYFDFSVIKSKTVQILLCSTCITNFGLLTPFFLMAYQGEKEGINYSGLLSLQIFHGLSVILGTIAFGFIVVKNSVECMIARQYLCQASSFMISASLLAFTSLGDYSGYLLFVWIHGFFYGGYQYSLKMFVYEKVRARNFNRAWSFVQCVQSLPILVGVSITAYINEYFEDRSGYFLSSFCTALGSCVMFFIDAHKKSIEKRKLSSPETSAATTTTTGTIYGTAMDHQNGALTHYCPADPRVFSHPMSTAGLLTNRRPSDELFLDNNLEIHRLPRGSGGGAALIPFRNPSMDTNFGRSLVGRTNSVFSSTFTNPLNAELTCISEEVILENFLDDFELDDCITSCGREEKYLMLSEFENNLDNTILADEATAAAASMLKSCKSNQQLKHGCNTNENKTRRSLSGFEFHRLGCPLRKVKPNSPMTSTSKLETAGLSAEQRRASFAGLSTFLNKTTTMKPISQPSTSQRNQKSKNNNNDIYDEATLIETSENLETEASHAQCPNCLKFVDPGSLKEVNLGKSQENLDFDKKPRKGKTGKSNMKVKTGPEEEVSESGKESSNGLKCDECSPESVQ